MDEYFKNIKGGEQFLGIILLEKLCILWKTDASEITSAKCNTSIVGSSEMFLNVKYKFTV